MPLPLTLSPAAVCQCFVLVSLCTSIADPNWIYVQNRTDPNSKQLVYGVAFTLHAAENLTNTAPLGGMNGRGMRLLYTLAALCYAAVLLSSSSFLLDFLGVWLIRPRPMMLLHVSTAVLCLAILCVSGACLYVIQQNLQKGKSVLIRAKSSDVKAYPGESLIIECLSLFFSIVASFFSCFCPLESVDRIRRLSEEAGETKRLTSDPGPEPEQWGEVLPTDESSRI